MKNAVIEGQKKSEEPDDSSLWYIHVMCIVSWCRSSSSSYALIYHILHLHRCNFNNVINQAFKGIYRNAITMNIIHIDNNKIINRGNCARKWNNYQ